MSKTVALKKAVADIVSVMPKELAYAPVQAAAVMGLYVEEVNGQAVPKVRFVSQVRPEIALMMLAQVATQLKADMAAQAAVAVNGNAAPEGAVR